MVLNVHHFWHFQTLIQLANDHKNPFLLRAKVILETSYVEDFLAEGNDVVAALAVKNQVIQILELGGF